MARAGERNCSPRVAGGQTGDPSRVRFRLVAGKGPNRIPKSRIGGLMSGGSWPNILTSSRSPSLARWRKTREEIFMKRTLLLLAIGGLLGAGAMTFAQHHEEGESVKILAAKDIKEKLDGKDAKVSFVEVTLEPGQGGAPHRHPGPGFVYVLEGEYELGIDDQPTKMLKAGETFYEPTGCLHRVSKNPGTRKRTRLIAVVLHPRDAKEIAIPEKAKGEHH
jgi:quercetin dioxygenase-like cupin family protein